VTAVVGCAFLEGGNAAERAAALTCDSRGRLVHHNVSAYLSITNFLAGGCLSDLQHAGAVEPCTVAYSTRSEANSVELCLQEGWIYEGEKISQLTGGVESLACA
jgi:hypothetical protein